MKILVEMNFDEFTFENKAEEKLFVESIFKYGQTLIDEIASKRLKCPMCGSSNKRWTHRHFGGQACCDNCEYIGEKEDWK